MLEASIVAGAPHRRRRDGKRHAVRPTHPRGARPTRADRGRRESTASSSPAARSAQSHLARRRSSVQDPYCLRCQPQVDGRLPRRSCATRRTYSFARRTAVTDNPLVFADDDGEIVSGRQLPRRARRARRRPAGRSRSPRSARSPERRIAMLIDASALRAAALPHVRARGVNSGFMIAHVTAAALASENKSLAHPASVDCLPTSANQEDHVSMATFAARRLSAWSTTPPTSSRSSCSPPRAASITSAPSAAPRGTRGAARAHPQRVSGRGRGHVPGTRDPPSDRARPRRIDRSCPPDASRPSDTSVAVTDGTAKAPVIRAARGTELRCRGWLQEAALRMLENNLDPDVAEDPANLVVYGGRARPRGRGRTSTRSSRS